VNWMKGGRRNHNHSPVIEVDQWAVNEVITTALIKPIHEVLDDVCAASHIAPTFSHPNEDLRRNQRGFAFAKSSVR
jgi:hypothetical protein